MKWNLERFQRDMSSSKGTSEQRVNGMGTWNEELVSLADAAKQSFVQASREQDGPSSPARAPPLKRTLRAPSLESNKH